MYLSIAFCYGHIYLLSVASLVIYDYMKTSVLVIEVESPDYESKISGAINSIYKNFII